MLEKNEVNLAASYYTIALMYHNMGEYSRALEYSEKSIELRKMALLKKSPSLATSYSNIGHVYNRMDEYSKALEY